MKRDPGFFPSAHILLLLFSVLILQMCSSDPSNPKDEPQDLDLAGDWELTTTITSNTCGLTDGTSETQTIVLAASDDDFSITTFDDPWGTA